MSAGSRRGRALLTQVRKPKTPLLDSLTKHGLPRKPQRVRVMNEGYYGLDSKVLDKIERAKRNTKKPNPSDYSSQPDWMDAANLDKLREPEVC